MNFNAIDTQLENAQHLQQQTLVKRGYQKQIMQFFFS